MGLFKRKTDPISDRAKTLKAEIAALDAEIKKLNSRLGQSTPGKPRVRSTALPGEQAAKSPEPIFEEVDRNAIQSPAEPPTTPEHYNDLGVRKYDLAAVIRRLRNQFRGPPTTNPKLINYLAAGSIHGLRPLRYEKRVARNRFIAVTIIFLLLLWGIFAVLLRR